MATMEGDYLMLRHTSKLLVTDSTRFTVDNGWGVAMGVIIHDKDADPVTLEGVHLDFLDVEHLDAFIGVLNGLSMDWHVRPAHDTTEVDAHASEGAIG